ncbi:MAG: zinc ribbon domain-containing protein [Promethearchaeota archaeon]
MKGKYVECEFCEEEECFQEKIEIVFDDPEFTKTFVDNMLDSRMDDIVNDCYLMAEVISGETSFKGISDFAYCIYVNLSRLVEMDDSKRKEIAKQFQEEFKNYGELIGKTREISHSDKKVKKTPDEAKKVASEDVSDDFLARLDAEIAEIEEISDQVEKMVTEPSTKVDLKPVIGKIPGSKIIIKGVEATKKLPITAGPPSGSKDNPIKLNPNILEGVVSDEDLAKVELGIKIKRIESTQRTFQPSRSDARSKVTSRARGKPSPVEGKRSATADDLARKDAISKDLFNAFQQVKSKNTSTPTIFNIEAPPKEEKTPVAGAGGLSLPLLDFSGGATPAGKETEKEKAIESNSIGGPPIITPESTELNFANPIEDVTKDTIICPHCGKEIGSGKKFCNKCGKKL